MATKLDEFDGLLARLRKGDEAALAKLLDRYADVIRRTARRLLGHALRPYLDSVDLVQSVHRTMLDGLRSQKLDISTPQKLVALALTILRRRVAKHWRHLKHEPEAESDTAGQTHLTQVPAPTRTENDPARNILFHDQVRHLMGKLDAVDRRLLQLRLEGHSTADAARELGMNPGCLRVRLQRLRQRLRDEGRLPDRN